MSRAELMVLLARLDQVVSDITDLRWDPAAPQHVALAADANKSAIAEASAELRRLHNLGQTP